MTEEVRGLPLEEYSKSVPPGWKPHQHSYPLRLYLEKLRLWLRVVDMDQGAIGPTVVGRLKGAAYRVAMKIRSTRQDGTQLTGDAAVAAPAEAETRDPNTGEVVQAASPSGLQLVLDALQAAYGEEEQDVQGLALDRFYNLWRGNGNLADYCTAFKIRYETAEEKAGLSINSVGLTHLFLSHDGLHPKFIDDIYLKVDGDRSLFGRIYNLVMRTAKQHMQHSDESDGNILMADTEPDHEGPTIEYFTDCNGFWYIYDHDIQASYYLDVAEEECCLWEAESWQYWDGASTNQDYLAWYESEEYDEYIADWDDDEEDTPGDDLDGTDVLLGFRSRRKGKGKGKGKGKKGKSGKSSGYPYRQKGYGKGKGSGKGFGKGKKGKGLSFKGGKSKGKGKGQETDSESPVSLLQQPVEEPQQAFKGASKGSHGCEECGSRWHVKKDCPTFKRKQKQVRFAALSSPFDETGPGLEPGSSSAGLDPGRNSSVPQSSFYDVSSLMHSSGRESGQQHSHVSALNLLESTADTVPAIGSGAQHFRLDLEDTPPRRGQMLSASDDVLLLHRQRSPIATSPGGTPLPGAFLVHGVLPVAGQPEVDKMFHNYHMVRGAKRYGFLIDEGASSGLAGTDTVREYHEAKVPCSDEHTIQDCEGHFTGINGEPVPGLGNLTQNALISNIKVQWSGAMIGGEGSYCPFLLPLPPLIEHRAILLHGLFDNGDGALIICPQYGSRVCVVRALLTDSGHYLLPTDRPKEQVADEPALAAIVVDALGHLMSSLAALTGQGSAHCSEADSGSAPVHVPPTQAVVQPELDQSRSFTAESHFLNKDQSQDNCQSQDHCHGQCSDNCSTNQSQHTVRTGTARSGQRAKTSMIQDWGGIPYTEDCFPGDFTDEEKKFYHGRYKHIPEEFYTQTGLQVVTPENLSKWCEAHKHLNIRWALQEQCSGSGRLSAEAHFQGLAVLFPVDFRYGWNLKNKRHRQLLQDLPATLRPIVKYSAPDCRLWTSVSNGHPDRERLENDRRDEKPYLEWIHEDNRKQASLGLGFVNENGLASQIWTQSPLSQITP